MSVKQWHTEIDPQASMEYVLSYTTPTYIKSDGYGVAWMIIDGVYLRGADDVEIKHKSMRQRLLLHIKKGNKSFRCGTLKDVNQRRQIVWERRAYQDARREVLVSNKYYLVFDPLKKGEELCPRCNDNAIPSGCGHCDECTEASRRRDLSNLAQGYGD